MADMSEHMEAFFGVNLEEKFVDVLKELDEYVDEIKDTSVDLRGLAKNISDDEIKNKINEDRNALFEIAQQIRDIKLFLEFYFMKQDGVRHIVQERDVYMKLFQIMKWDTIDVRDLRRWLDELKELCGKIGLRTEDLINFKRIASQPIPEDIASYPVLVLDKHGYCLSGEKWDIVIHKDEVRDAMGL
ncbi:MAG TPA: hypothetical protein VN372_00025 [Methanospirillum sp.]|nr:hypothetical protein [Methanospirillum sp.]